MTPARKLKNLGKVSTGWLESIGIVTEDDLARVGVIEAYRQLKSLYPDRVSLNLLWGMQAALLGIHWRMVSDEMKDELRAALAEAEARAGQIPTQKL